MSDKNITSLANKLQDLELCLNNQVDQEVGYGKALREAIIGKVLFSEVEVLKSLGDLHLKKAKLSKDPAEFDKAAALYAAALLRCTDPDMGQTLEHRIGYMEKLSRQLLQGYSPNFLWLSPDYWGTADSNILRVAEICDQLDKDIQKSQGSGEDIYTETLVTAVTNSDMFLELEVLKSLGDFYLEKGKKTSDLSQFSKAAAMYKKALTKCGGPETKLTLKHRIEYMEKIREAVRRYSDHLKEGASSLARADLDSAEQHFAAALKMVHVRDPTAQQYQREVEPLCKLGDVYSKRGQQTGDGGDFVKAAALYNAAIARSEDQVLNGNIETAIREVEKSFLKCILDISYTKCKDETEKHKKQLKEMRDKIKLEMETIDQQLDPYVNDEDDPCVKEIEAKRAQAVRNLFENIAQERKEFISLLVEESIGLMGPPPCKYALIGLGSQATGLVTPYSDLEFAILVEEENEECLVYFRNLTHYLHLKVVNLGETILPALGIKSLNDFYSEDPLHNWYHDSVTPRGFAFDGSMPKASKTPLGRQGTVDEPPSELISTPENMASKLQKDVKLYLKEEYHLATILRNPCLIAGGKDLIDTYKAITGEILQADGGKMAQQLAQETLRENIQKYLYSNKETITARLIDVKKKLYRFPAVAVDCFALSTHIVPTTVWETIEEMENQQVISSTNAHHLTVLTSISAELRLRTYIANGGQKENLSALASMETALQTNDEVQTNAVKPVFHVTNKQELFRYYFTAVPLKHALSEWSGDKSGLNLFPVLYKNSLHVKGLMYYELCNYRLAISCHVEAITKHEDTLTMTEKIDIFDMLGPAYHRVGQYQMSVGCHELALDMYGKLGQGREHPNIARVYNNMGMTWFALGNYKKAISHYEQALQMFRTIYGQTTAHAYIAGLLNNMGGAWSHLGDYRKALSYFEVAFQMLRSVHGQSTVHTDIATSLNNLGGAWHHLGDYRKATSYHEQALQMYRSVYGHNTAHPTIAKSFNNLGASLRQQGDYRKSLRYDEQALQMYRSIYGQNTAHPDIATSLNNLGETWDSLGDHRKAISYHEQALEMCRSVYGESKPHTDIARSLNNLAAAWRHLGDYRKAISYLEQAQQMYRSIHGLDTTHSDFATALTNTGSVLSALGDYRKAISCYEQALQMRRSIYGQETAHPDIAMSLNNLGVAFHKLSDHRRAITYHEEALQMRRSIYGETTAHPDIAQSLNNVGSALEKLGDYVKAIDYYEQALQMYRSVYGENTPHPDIANELNNLGTAWHNLTDETKSIRYFEEALQMYRAIYDQSIARPDIAATLYNLGSAWDSMGQLEKASSYYEEALQMYRSIHGQNIALPHIALLLVSLGSALVNSGQSKSAISHLEEALQMFRSIHGQNSARPEIVVCLNGLGMACHHLGDHQKAVSLCHEALAMAQQLHPKEKDAPLMQLVEMSLGKISPDGKL
uniref:Uncharacterized protein n=1 Tax=Branchiostoma floridae TaxID=7739 RepID=C3YHG4_BRAFL|eukprot:XP_002603940.1 hypothetical protein BRAFLDRAFT_102379 [Branchiostoma floridae]